MKLEGHPVRTGEDTKRAQKTGNNENGTITRNWISTAQTEPHETKNENEAFSQRFDDAIESGFTKNLKPLDNKVPKAIHGISKFVNSLLAEGLRPNNTATNGSKPFGSRANFDV